VADVSRLLAELDAAREAFLEALSNVDADLVLAPGVVDDWSVRDVVVHVAAWDDHGADALALAAAGRGGEFAYSTADTDAMNERILAEARAVSPAEALEREERAFGRLRGAVEALDPALLSHRLGNGDSVEEVIRYDGPDHYAEHTEHIRAWFGADGEEEDDEPA
jgi:hypothetical protein